MTNYDLFNKLLDEKIYDAGSQEIVDSTPRDYMEDKTIEAIETHINFFKDIPKEDISRVLKELIEILFEYDTDKGNFELEKMFCLVNTKKKASIQINQDIGIIKKYQSMIERLYGIKSKKDNHYIFMNIPEEVSKVYEANKKIIDDLEQEKFNIIPKSKYHNEKKTYKK